MERLYAPWRMAYIDQPKPDSTSTGAGCIFCDKPEQDKDDENLIVFRGDKAFVLLNLFPYNNGHLMVAPYRHVARLTNLEPETLLEMMTLTQRAQRALDRAFHPE